MAKTTRRRERVIAFSGEEQFIVPNKNIKSRNGYSNLADSGTGRSPLDAPKEYDLIMPIQNPTIGDTPISPTQPVMIQQPAPEPVTPAPVLPSPDPINLLPENGVKQTPPSLIVAPIGGTGGLPVEPPKKFDVPPSDVIKPSPATPPPATVLATPAFAPVFGGGGGGFGAAPSGNEQGAKKSNMGLWLILAIGVGIYLLTKKS